MKHLFLGNAVFLCVCVVLPRDITFTLSSNGACELLLREMIYSWLIAYVQCCRELLLSLNIIFILFLGIVNLFCAGIVFYFMSMKCCTFQRCIT